MKFAINKYQFEVPGEWQEADKTALSKELPGVVAYWKQQTETYLMQLVIQDVPTEHIDYLQPFDVDTVVKRAHEQMDESRGLIEVSVVKTVSGREMLRTILKESANHLPMYVARFQHKNDDGSGFLVQLIGKEVGMTGSREAMILASNMPQVLTKTTDASTGETLTQGAPIPDWTADPYDPSYKRGFLMNKSEDVMFDQQFPNHPLSVLRAYLESIQNSLSKKQPVQASPASEETTPQQPSATAESHDTAPNTVAITSTEEADVFVKQHVQGMKNASPVVVDEPQIIEGTDIKYWRILYINPEIPDDRPNGLLGSTSYLTDNGKVLTRGVRPDNVPFKDWFLEQYRG